MKKLSATQIHTLEILENGGQLFVWDDGGHGLDDVDSNTLPFRSSTFDVLNRYKLITIVRRPCLGCEVYGLTDGAKALFYRIKLTECLARSG